VDILEEDRRSLSMMLHDDIGQCIAGTKMEIEALKLDLATETALEVPGKIDHAVEALQGIMASLRNTSRQLRPGSLDTLGLAAALRSIETKGATCRIRHFVQEDPRSLDPGVKLAVFRIAQEAVTNAVRHAGCSEIQVSLAFRDGALVLMVEDDGCGFSWNETMADGGDRSPLGLLVMRERACNAGGEFLVETLPGKGTLVRAEFPLTMG
jgi:signal transduction histidine kinase